MRRDHSKFYCAGQTRMTDRVLKNSEKKQETQEIEYPLSFRLSPADSTFSGTLASLVAHIVVTRISRNDAF